MKTRETVLFLYFGHAQLRLVDNPFPINFSHTSIKGVAERSSVFASEIFTAISQISEESPEVIHINEMLLKRNGYIGLKPATSLSKYENNKEK